MYLWIALQLNDELIPSIRKEVEDYSKKNGIETTALELPQHISLKISFQVSSMDVLEDLVNTYKKQKPFEIQFKSFDYHNGLLWMTFQHSSILESIHETFDQLLLRKYEVPRHQFDKNFYFHSTLVYDMNPDVQNKIETFTTYLNQTISLSNIVMNKYIIGVSESGLPGTFTVINKGNLGE